MFQPSYSRRGGRAPRAHPCRREVSSRRTLPFSRSDAPADRKGGGPMIRALFRIAGLCFLPPMRIGFSIVTLVIAVAAAVGESVASPASFATDQRIVYSDGL